MPHSDDPSERKLGHRLRRKQGEAARYYGRILILIVLTMSTGIALGGESWGSLIYLTLQAVTLLLALRTSDASRRAKQVSVLLLIPVLVAAGVTAILGSGRLGDAAIGLIGATLVLIALMAIGREVAKHPDVTGPTVMAALCIYLLIGLFFAYLQQFVGGVDSGPFFAGHGDGTPSEYIYFSYITLTTVGLGDLVPAGNVGRSITVTEAIIGQLYLVTVVGFTVANFAGRRRDNAHDESERDSGPG